MSTRSSLLGTLNNNTQSGIQAVNYAEPEKQDKTKLPMERKGIKQKQLGNKRCKQKP